MKKIIAILLILSCVLTGLGVSAAAYDDVDSVITSGYIQSGKIGNIFSITDKNIKFTQSYENISGGAVNIQSVYQVRNEANRVVKEYPVRSIEIPAGESATLEFEIENPGKYGLYNLKVTNRISAGGVRYEKIYTEGFSVCIDLNENNVDPNFGFAQQIIRNGYGDADVTPTLMRKAGASWYREDCMTWSMVETAKGVYTIPEGTKEKLQKIKDSGLNIICILNGTNGKLYKFPSTEEGINAYVKYCEFVAKELEGLVDTFEIWNEWNKKIETDTAGYYLRTDIYADVLTRASEAVKGVNENNTVIGCTTAGIDLDWIEGVLENLGDNKPMDALSVHCYPWTESDGVDEAQLVDYTAELKELMKKYSYEIPVWVTEIGFSTFKGVNNWMPPCTTEEQLNALVLVNAMNKAYGLFDKLIQYSFHDRANISGVESNWGLLNCWQRGLTENPEAELTPYGAKPSYLGIAAMNYFIGGNAEFEELIKDKQDRAYMIKFKNNNIDKNVMLCINGDLNTPTQKSVKLDTNSVKLYDKYGNFVGERTSETGDFSFEISAEPMYVTWGGEENGEFLNVTADENSNTITISGTAEGPGDLVSVLVVSKHGESDEYNPAQTLFVGQATADAYGLYRMSFIMDELEGEFIVYANSKMRKDKQKDDIVFSYSIPEIKVMQGGMDVFGMTELDSSVPVDIELRGFVDLTDEKPVLIIAQYSNGQLIFAELDEEAVGDCTEPGTEIKKSFEVKAGADKIKVMYMNINNIKPFVAAYEIK